MSNPKRPGLLRPVVSVIFLVATVVLMVTVPAARPFATVAVS